MKGQVEFVVILGILVIAVVAVYFAWQGFAPTTAPVAVTQEQKVVQESINNFIRAGALDTLRKLSLYGGWLEPQTNSVTYLGKQVNYWQYQGSVNYPDLQANLISGITSYLRANRASIEGSLAAKNVTVGEPAVSAQVLDNRIILTVNMPTTMKGSPIPQPYTVTIQTRLGEIYGFSKKLAASTAQDRFIEYSVLSSMALSPFENDVQITPLTIYLTDCGQHVFKDWWDIKAGIEDRIEVTLAHIYMPGKVPLNTMDTASHPKYIVPPVDGKIYNLDVSFFTPDDFALTPTTLQFTPNPITAVSQPVPQTPYCRSDPVNVKYYFTFPAIVEIKDPLTDNLFRFAVSVYVKDNLPGSWEDLGGYATTEQQLVCENPGCTASLTVVNSAGVPIPGASVSFMGCILGRTDDSGRLVSSAPCGAGRLVVQANGYGSYDENLDHSQLVEKTITLPKKVFLTLNLYEVVVQNVTALGAQAGTQTFWIDAIGPDEVGGINHINTDPDHGNEVAYINFYNQGRYALEQNPVAYNTQTGTVQLDAGTYSITGVLLSDLLPKGSFLAEKEITEDLDGKELHIYLPYLEGYESITDTEEEARIMFLLTRILERCGIGPVSETPVTFENMKTATFDGSDVSCV